jgi:hypothetical protein
LAGVAILYWSTAVSGGLVAVSGVLVQRAGGQPDPPRAIVAWAHGTVGLGDQCAPSQEYFRGSGGSVPVAQLRVCHGDPVTDGRYLPLL